MDKNSFFDKVKDKVSKEDFEKVWAESEKEAKEREVPKEDLEAVTIGLTQAALKKRLLSPAKEFEGVIFGINQNAALNNIVDKVKQHSLDAKKKNTDDAFKDGAINDKGNPVWHKMEGINVADFKIGKEISAVDYQQTVMLLAKQPDDDGDLKLARLRLNGNKRLSNNSLLFKKLKFRANVNKKSTEDTYILSQSTATEFSVLDDSVIKFEDYAVKFLKRNCSSLSGLRDWIIKHKDEGFDRFSIVKSNVANVNITAPGISNIITLDDIDLPMDESVTGWVDESFDINFQDDALDVFVIGRPSHNEEEDKLSIDIYGVWAPEMWRIKESEKPKDIGKDESEKKEEAPKSEDTTEKKKEVWG